MLAIWILVFREVLEAAMIVSIVAASLLKVPWIAVSPCSMLRRVIRPLIGATIVVLLMLDCASRNLRRQNMLGNCH